MYKLSICTIVKDEDQYLDEWVGYHIDKGVEHIYLYDNGSNNPQQNCISKENLKYCTIIPYPKKDGNPQVECYNQFLKDYGADSKWVAVIDADEFIRVVDSTPLPEFLKEYEQHDALYAGWVTYNADGQLTNDGRPVRERFHNVVDYKESQCGKSIIRPDKVSRMGIHFPAPVWIGKQDVVDENHNYIYDSFYFAPPMNKIVIDHYFTKSWEEWQHKINRGAADNSDFRKTQDFFRYNPDLVDVITDMLEDKG